MHFLLLVMASIFSKLTLGIGTRHWHQALASRCFIPLHVSPNICIATETQAAGTTCWD